MTLEQAIKNFKEAENAYNRADQAALDAGSRLFFAEEKLKKACKDLRDAEKKAGISEIAGGSPT